MFNYWNIHFFLTQNKLYSGLPLRASCILSTNCTITVQADIKDLKCDKLMSAFNHYDFMKDILIGRTGLGEQSFL